MHFAMKRASMRNVALALLCFVLVSAQGAPQGVRETVIVRKDLSEYARSDMALTVRELEFPPGFVGASTAIRVRLLSA